ncbi:MAG TPA: hypothetical protein VE844_04035, partial [Gammaproteobacteria bacterium]|nr:hypothetical protein [Gammaproteobacteria bacterium]
PIVVDRTRQMRKTAIITEEVRLQFAMEAVDMHFSRCAALQEYINPTTLLNEALFVFAFFCATQRRGGYAVGPWLPVGGRLHSTRF